MQIRRRFHRKDTLFLSLPGLLLFGLALAGQAQNKPAAEYQSLLNLRF